jgi:hypothetical protein
MSHQVTPKEEKPYRPRASDTHALLVEAQSALHKLASTAGLLVEGGRADEPDLLRAMWGAYGLAADNIDAALGELRTVAEQDGEPVAGADDGELRREPNDD